MSDDLVRVWVHIADVSAFVRPGSATERETFRRATSVYVPGAVEPMLPEALSNEACSLKPGVPRFAVTVEMELRLSDAVVVSASFHRSEIRSDKRLVYDEVDEIFAGARPRFGSLGEAAQRGPRRRDRAGRAPGAPRRARGRVDRAAVRVRRPRPRRPACIARRRPSRTS